MVEKSEKLRELEGLTPFFDIKVTFMIADTGLKTSACERLSKSSLISYSNKTLKSRLFLRYKVSILKKFMKINASHLGIIGPIDQKILSDLRNFFFFFFFFFSP